MSELRTESAAESATEPPSPELDWGNSSNEVFCPLCRYNLRGLSDPRCPECGCRFEWAEVLDPQRRHPYLFEHNPQRNFRSFWRTLWAGLRARTFWTKLRPAHEVSARRLVIYWVLCSFFVLLAPVAEVLRIGVFIANNNANARAYFPPAVRGRGATPAQIQQYMDRQFPLPPSAGFFRQMWDAAAGQRIVFSVGLNAGTILLWPWMTLAALMIFQASMKKAKVQKGHVLRCVIYSADASVWYLFALLLVMLSLIIDGSMRARNMGRSPADQWVVWLVWALWLVRLDRLWTAYKKYLQFDHPFFTALASQIVVVLAGAALFFWVGRVVVWLSE